MFKNIGSLNKGDIIEVETGEGKKIQYKVTKIETKKVADIDMGDVLSLDGNGPELKLMTCGGEFNAEKQEYESRVILHSTQI